MKRYLGCVVLGAPIIMLATIASAQVASPLPSPALTDGAGVSAAPPQAGAPPALAVTDPVGAVAGALTLGELEEENGRQGVYVYANSSQALSATNSGNSITADHVGSGNISLSEGAFAGFAGIGNFVINSGHNNNLQGSLSIMIVTP